MYKYVVHPFHSNRQLVQYQTKLRHKSKLEFGITYEMKIFISHLVYNFIKYYEQNNSEIKNLM